MARYLLEREVVKLWQSRPGYGSLVDSQGLPVDVVYPGRPNYGRGADFRDAVVTSSGERHLGHIEFHSRVSNWHRHGHSLDPVYNQVVLHVAWEQDKDVRTTLQSGKSIPTVILSKQPDRDTSAGMWGADLPCRTAFLKKGREEVLAILANAGKTRFYEKAAHFLMEMGSLEAGESLYRGILEALGYSQNKRPFLELARQLPLRLLEQVIHDRTVGEADLVSVQALMLGKAGFLASRQITGYLPRGYLIKLEKAMSTLPKQDSESNLAWEFFRLRPSNHPFRRILAFTYLLQRFHPKGIIRYFLDLVSEIPPEGSYGRMEAALIVNDRLGQAFLGRERAAAIIINVVLPFIYAWGQQSDASLSSKAVQAFIRYHRLETNSIEQHMLYQLRLKRRNIDSSCYQQGLVHIFKTFCSLGRCRECLLGRAGNRL